MNDREGAVRGDQDVVDTYTNFVVPTEAWLNSVDHAGLKQLIDEIVDGQESTVGRSIKGK
jgi:hypothetical protein